MAGLRTSKNLVALLSSNFPLIKFCTAGAWLKDRANCLEETKMVLRDDANMLLGLLTRKVRSHSCNCNKLAASCGSSSVTDTTSSTIF